MGRVIRNDISTLSKLVSRVSDSTYLDYQKDLIEDKHNLDFQFATDIIPIQKESPFASEKYVDIIARAQRVNVPDKAQYLGDDFRKLLFKDIEEDIALGQKFIIDNNYWLCFNTNNMGSVTKSCHIRKCNSSLKWKNIYGVTQEEPCVIEYFKFTITNNAIEFDKMMRLGGNLRLITIQNNLKTAQLKRDMRFIFNDLSWRVTNIEKTTHNGLIEMTVEEHQIDSAYDDFVNRIADASQPIKIVIDVSSNNGTLLIGESYTVSYRVLYDGKEITEECVITSSDENIVSEDDGIILGEGIGVATIRVALAENESIYSQFIVNVYAVSEESYIYGSDITKFGGTYRYTVKNPVDASYVFSCADSTITVSRVDGFSCDIKVPNIKKTFIISAEGDAETLTKSVEIGSMW